MADTRFPDTRHEVRTWTQIRTAVGRGDNAAAKSSPRRRYSPALGGRQRPSAAVGGRQRQAAAAAACQSIALEFIA